MPEGSEFYIFAEGEDEEKNLGGRREIVRPVCFAKGRDYLGIALIDKKGDGYPVSIPSIKQRVLATYRGMKIAEKIDDFLNIPEALKACMMAGRKREDIYPIWFNHVRRIEQQIGKRERERILREFPENLEEILEKLCDMGVRIEEEEIMEEYRHGRIKNTPTLQRIMNLFIDDYSKST